jgi:CRISPR-associated protein Csm4
MLYGKDELETLLNEYQTQKPPFLISSAFPFKQDILLFPLPKVIDLGEDKNYKKIEFISQDIFESLCKIGKFTDKLSKYHLCFNKKILSTKPIDEIYRILELPRVTLDRKTSLSQIYYFSQVEYLDKAGLYFFIKFTNSRLTKKIKAAINLLADEGIGGDRTSGKGLFKKPQFEEITLNIPHQANYFVTLSLYFPTYQEIKALSGYYDWKQRSGYIYSQDVKNLRKKSIRVFVEGSVFKDNENIGDLVDITPQGFSLHHVYRYGYAFKIPIEVNENGV